MNPKTYRLSTCANSYRRPAFLLSAIILLLSCSHPTKSAAPPPAAPPEERFPGPVHRAREADDAARFLAGLPGADGSAFAELEKEEAWKIHRQEMDRAWGAVEADSFPAMRTFQKAELNTAAIKNSIVFYPFSGPDAIMVSLFFPANSTYVMAGLEPPGTLPTAKQFRQNSLAKKLASERDTVSSIIHRSFFVTREMDHQFRGQVTDGLLPPILHLLVRNNRTILGYRYVRLDDSGKVVERPLDYVAPTKYANKGVQVEFIDNGTQNVHTLYYFSGNVDDEHLQENKAFVAFVKKLSPMTTYLKATSYMTHRPEFSIIRNAMLEGSSAVLQDDSGIPYKYFAQAPWHVQLYGTYDMPIRPFRYLKQADLKHAYTTSGPKPLTFDIGYGANINMRSNLLFATKATDAKPPEPKGPDTKGTQ